MTAIPAALLARFPPDLTGGGHHLALRQVTVADHALMAVLGFQIGMLTEKVPSTAPTICRLPDSHRH
jgi:hypothetical protein